MQAADALIDDGEPYELGLAVSVGPEGAAVLVSYNARTRGPAPRRRMLQALVAHGLPLAPAKAALQWVPDARCSTVLGLQWPVGGGPAEATLYLEEVSRFWAGSALARTTERLAGIAGLSPVSWEPDPGEPYIWALDLGVAGPKALKLYRWVDDLPGAVVAVAPGLPGAVGDALRGGVRPAGGILQRRYRGAGAAALKIYKAYPYEAGEGRGDAAAEVATLLGPLDRDGAFGQVAPLLADLPLTSVGLRLRGDQVVVGTAYWCLARGTGATLSAPASGG
ncbi:MAG: hypothetical protein H6742_15815 [Alphaproteobacteria bacterium]|nr:hypothetical protein [Alphaproteobacteria bacterium]